MRGEHHIPVLQVPAPLFFLRGAGVLVWSATQDNRVEELVYKGDLVFSGLAATSDTAVLKLQVRLLECRHFTLLKRDVMPLEC